MTIPRLKRLDRYYITYFEKFLILATLSVIFVFILVNFFERLDHFMAKKPSPLAIAQYYMYQVPYLIVLLLPVAALLSSFFSIGESARRNEVLVLKASGIPVYRVFMPILFLGILHSAIAFFVNDRWAPEWTRKARITKVLKIEHRKRIFSKNYARNLSFWAQKDRLYFFGALDARINEARNITVIEFEKDHVKRRIDASKARFNGEYWTFFEVTERTFNKEGGEIVRILPTLEKKGFTTKPREFLRESRELKEMSLKQLKKRIRLLKMAGMETTVENVETQVRYSFPLANLIILLFALPLAVSQRGHGRAYGFGFSVALSFLYWTLLQFSRVIGESGRISPFLAAWTPNIFFFVLGIVAILKLRK